jgi:hypothetical protein
MAEQRDRQPLVIVTRTIQAAVLKAGGHEQAATGFARFLVAEGWLAHWLDFVGAALVAMLVHLQPNLP